MLLPRGWEGGRSSSCRGRGPIARQVEGPEPAGPDILLLSCPVQVSLLAPMHLGHRTAKPGRKKRLPKMAQLVGPAHNISRPHSECPALCCPLAIPSPQPPPHTHTHTHTHTTPVPLLVLSTWPWVPVGSLVSGKGLMGTSHLIIPDPDQVGHPTLLPGKPVALPGALLATNWSRAWGL